MIKLDDDILNEIYPNGIPVLEDAKRNVYRKFLAEYLKKSLKTGKVSKLFFEQLLYFPDTGMRNSFEWIIDEIAYMEGIKEQTRADKAQAFRGESLKGLWKKHFYNPRLHNITNFANTLKLDKPDSPILSEIFKCAVKKEGLNRGVTLDKIEKVSGVMAQTAVDKMNNKKHTGDWIIFVKNNGVNYYLCVFPHSQKPEDDIAIKELCKKCIDDFPFLQNVLSN